MKRFLAILLGVMTMATLFACGADPSDTIVPDATDIANDDTDAPATSAPETNAPDTDVNETNAPVLDEPSDATDTEGNGKHVVALLMGRARLPGISGKYNTWQNNGHSPDASDETGRRDIASVCYPSIGLYDVTDPDYQEYMMQLCKMSYIDTLNYYLSSVSDLEDGSWWGDSFKKTTLPMLEKYGLSTTARLEDPDNAIPESGDTTAVRNAFSGILQLLGDTVLEIDERPVLAQFKVTDLTSEDILKWKDEHLAKYGVVPFFMLREASTYYTKYKNCVDGFFGWCDSTDINSLPLQYTENVGDYRRYITADEAMVNHDLYVERIKNLIANGKIASYYSEGLNPGFDDLAVWGWGTGPRKIERGENCELYEYKWQSAVKNGFPMVDIVTWDDWGEATVIEPTLEYGVEYLEITRKYAAEFKGIEANTASLELPGWIYKIRKTTTDKTILDKMAEASDLIANGRFDEAEAIVKPYVASLNIPETSKDFFQYPTTPTKVIGESDAPVPTQGANGEEIFNPTADTYIKIATNKNADAGIEELVKVKSADSTNLTRHGYFKFDTAKTQLSAVKKATLRLYCKFASTKPEEVASRDIKLYATSADWTECTFSWDEKPTPAEKLAEIESDTFKGKTWIEIDVTDYVNAHLGEKIAFVMINEGQDTENNHLEFYSREAAEFKPELVIE